MAHTRPADARDADAIAAIYNHAIDERIATFETRHRTAADIEDALRSADRFPFVVAEHDGEVTAFARVGGYNEREAYRGVGELMLYVHPEHRRSGVGRHMTAAIAHAARDAGYWKLIALVFTSNEPMVALLNACGYEEVGVHRRHGQLDGEWRDVMVLESLLDAG